MVALARNHRCSRTAHRASNARGGMSSPNVFVVSFEHAHRAFRCIRLEGPAGAETPTSGVQWIVTLEGRTVWSFDAHEGDTRESVQREVEEWWDRSQRTASR